jgi:soluble lytic murein transglycosylase
MNNALLDLLDGRTTLGLPLRKRGFPLIACALFLSCLQFAPTYAQSLSRDARTAVLKALGAADANRWPDAVSLARRSGLPVAPKIIEWMRLTDENGGGSFEEVTAFIAANPDWPHQDRLRRRAEEAMGPEIANDKILAWFARNPAVSADGAFHHARVLEATGRLEDAARFVRESWRAMEMGRKQAEDFRRRFRKYIRDEDDVARLDRLLWLREVGDSRRQKQYVSKDWRALTESRISFMVRSRKAPRTVGSVPKALREDPGYIFEQVRWHRRMRRPEDAVSILLRHPKLPPGWRPDRWWRERQYLVRWALSEEKPSLAYELASTHVQTDGRDFAEAEWLSGWIALRKLNKPKDALRHFMALYDNVTYPVSRSRGAYWLARSYEALEQHNIATRWYREAAVHVTRFYGQLAAGHLLEAERPKMPAETTPTAAETTAFEAGELPQVVRIMAAVDRRRDVRLFMRAIADKAKRPTDWSLAARLALDIGRHDLAVSVSKLALRKGVILSDSGYPALEPASAASDRFPDPAILHAVVRQESAFDTQAISHAGARGLMQIMPQTALRVARRLKMPYSRQRLTRDPTYNLRLGQAYLADMLSTYDGSLILTFAAYNAGPIRVERWLQRYGDPGPNIYDAIDWTESIPFTETRNYVQRVLENLAAYRSREQGQQLAITYASLEPGPFEDSAGRIDRGINLPFPDDTDDGDDFAGP